jgi:hypothetical protein
MTTAQGQFCRQCGSDLSPGAKFCPYCGATRAVPLAPTAEQSKTVSNGFSTASIICGAFAFLFFPIVLGPAGLILAAIAASKHEPQTPVAFVVSGLGMAIGMLIGIAVFAARS